MTELPEMNSRATLQRAIYEALVSRGPLTITELAVHLGRTRNNIWKTIREPRHKELVHVHSWEPSGPAGGGPQAVFAYGPGVDAPKPKGVARQTWYRRNYESRRRRVNIEELGMTPDNMWKGLLR